MVRLVVVGFGRGWDRHARRRYETLIRGSLSHVDLTVSELERSVAFYDRVLGCLGFRRLDEFGAGAPCWGISDSQSGYFSIALQSTSVRDERADRSRCGVHHLAFHADDRDDVDEIFEFVVHLGATVLDPPADYAYTPGYYAVFFEDPDGFKLEVVHEPALRGIVSRAHDVEAFFRAYSDAFDAFDGDRVAGFFHVPCMLVNGSHAVSLGSTDSVLQNVQALIRFHAASGYAHSEIGDIEILSRSDRFVRVAVPWRVLREGGSVLWSWQNDYHLADYGSGWKILVSTSHESA